MSARRLHWSLTGVWMALAGVTLMALDSTPARGLLLFLVFGLAPFATLFGLRNEERPLVVLSPHRRYTRL